MKRRILSSLMALMLVFGLLPVSAMAEAGDWDPLTNPDNVKGYYGGEDYRGSGTTQFTIGAGIGQLKVMPTLDTLHVSYNAMAYCGAKAVSSAPDVVEVSTKDGHQDIVIGKWQGGDWDNADCLQVNVNPKKAGTATVTITFYYTFSQSDNPITNENAKWFSGTCYYTVKVVDPDANKPAKPGKSAIDSFWELSTGCAVRLDCGRVEDHYALYVRSNDGNNNLSYWGNYELGEVAANPGNLGMGKDNYPWVCPMTIDASGFLEYYNYGYPGHEGYAKTEGVHMLADGQEDPTVYWFWDKKDNIWKFNPSDAPVEIEITCPDLPSEDDIIDELGENAVKVECETDSTKHPAKFYELTKDSLTIPELPSWSDSKGYYIDVAVAADDYVDDYETAYGNHTLKNESPQTITLYYDKDTPKWSPSDDATAPYVTFEVKHEGIPAKPDVDTIYKDKYLDPDGNPYVGEDGSKEFAVILKCNKVTKHIYGFNSLGLVDGGYTLGDVVDNEDENTKTAYPYTCTMTVDYTKYVDQANRDYQGEDGEHEIVAGTKTTREIVWYYNRASKSWIVLAENDRAPIVIPVTCEKAPDADMLETAVENAKLYVDCETVDSHNRQAIALNGYDKATVTTKPYMVVCTDKTATVTITDQKAYADQYKPGGAAHTYDSGNQSNRNTFNMEWKKGADGWNWYLKGEPALIMTTCTPKPTDDDVKKALDGLEKDVRVTCVTEKNNHGSETYAVKLGLPENWRLGEETNWNGHIGYEVEAPTSSFVKLFISKHGTHTVKDGMPETLRWVIYWDGSSWKAAAHGNPAEIEVEHVNAPDTYQVTVKNSTATNSGAGFYEADKTVTIHAGSRSNYTFIGWTTRSGVTFADASRADTTFKMPAKAVEVTANWKYTGSDSDNDKDDDYTLKYVTNGGKVISSETKSRSWVKDYEDLPTPTRSGYRFEGWYYDTRLTDKVTDDVKVNKTVVTLYARWSSSETPGMLNDEDHFAYVQGYSDGNVHPYGLISRAETTTIFFRLLTDEVRDDNLLTSNTYTDVTNDYWANTAISTMTGLGIVQGRSATTFDPKAPITRAQFAAICARFDTGVSSGSRTFSDISGHWAEKYIERAAELSWIQGFADGTFRPDTYITRAQAMTMINRVLNRTPEDEEDLLEGMKVWPDCNPSDWFYLAVQEATNSHDYKDRGGEVWTKLTRDPDWTRYER